MIEVTKKHGQITVNGHAGFAPCGSDIVCAAVSMLVQNLVCSIQELTEDTIEYEGCDGNAVIKYGNLSEGAKLLLDSFLLGVEMIASNYPQYVRLNYPEKSDSSNMTKH